MRLYPQVPLPPEAVEQWNTVLMPQINQALRNFYRKHILESVEISLESIGESPRETRPTVLVVCTSVGKVRNILKRKLGALFDDTSGFALKVCRGQVMRSRNRGIPRSMAKGDSQPGSEIVAANGDFQARPRNGASIGAWIGDRHLPPVSFGGLVMVDNKPYGMTVHHMLDDIDAELEYGAAGKDQQVLRSTSAAQEIEELTQSLHNWYAELQADSSAASSEDEYACEFSDNDSDTYSESAITSAADSDDEEDEEDDQFNEPGDVPGIEPGCGDDYIVTQPALDDVDEGFYPNMATQDEDHIVSFGLGNVYASSGIRRRSDENGLIHEIDWALFDFKYNRRPEQNFIPSVDNPLQSQPLRPTQIAPAKALPGLEVQCVARSSGLGTGLILPTITSVKIHGRISPSHTYQVSGVPSQNRRQGEAAGMSRHLPIGVPGDSGAWVVDRDQGRLCGHVLAWSGRKKVAYICPMDILLLDIAETLEAEEIRLPDGEPVVKIKDSAQDERYEGNDSSEPDEWDNHDENRKHPRERKHGHSMEDEGFHDDEVLGDLVHDSDEAPPSFQEVMDEKHGGKDAEHHQDGEIPTEKLDLSRVLDKMHFGGGPGVQAQC